MFLDVPVLFACSSVLFVHCLSIICKDIFHTHEEKGFDKITRLPCYYLQSSMKLSLTVLF